MFNDQYSTCDDPWAEFIQQVELAEPPIEVLGITDYLRIDGYKVAVERKRQGALSKTTLLFPNVELRFGIETSKGATVNVHLLFSPDDEDHVEQIERLLGRLLFRYREESYSCTRGDLVRLGRAHKAGISSDDEAFKIGANQFKVNFPQLQDIWRDSRWMRENCLIAVAAGEGDGTSGMRDEGGSLEALRKSIEAFAHVMLSANPKQIAFWRGEGAATVSDLEAKWGGMKPCLHGSDAHELARIGNPDYGRLCWLKGDASFETLRYACMEPRARVHIGEAPPSASFTSKTIASLAMTEAPWMTPSQLGFNPGLVAVIGSRGSGKTALADLIAAGGLSVSDHLSEKSFLSRARDHLGDGRVTLTWSDGQTTGNLLSAVEMEDLIESPRVQYLSQQFVDELCSAEGVTDALVEEIHRVVFNSHSTDQREGATSFDGLLTLRTHEAELKRQRMTEQFDVASTALQEERQLKASVPALTQQKVELKKLIEQDEADRKKLIGAGQTDRIERQQAVMQALDRRQRALETVQLQVRALKGLQADVLDLRQRRLPSILTSLREDRAGALLNEKDWADFDLVFAGDVDGILSARIATATAKVSQLLGTVPPLVASVALDKPLIAADVDLDDQSVSLLKAELERLAQLIGVDRTNAKRFSALGERLQKNQKALGELDGAISHASTADSRIESWKEKRRSAYRGIFEAIQDLESELQTLYKPLQKSLAGQSGSLGKLGVVVRRSVDIARWAMEGEGLLDLRKAGPFRGRGSLLDAAKEKLLSQWQRGRPEEVSRAMQGFIEENETALKSHRPDASDFRTWASAVSAWLHSTAHIRITYSLVYDGIDIERLSPGTRGIVLLLLYLAVDNDDDRPLIIDQPEENLDPKSVFDELVDLFRVAKTRRQVIIVTHNANLVVNTDADQVIFASAGSHEIGQLPPITYVSGGLENPEIRKHVCNVLEGGERAFRARAKRLRLRFSDAIPEQISVVTH